MKCPACQSEWTVRSSMSQPKNCPFCGASLEPRQKKPESLEDSLRQVYRQFGEDPFRSGKALISLLADLMPDRQQDRRMLTLLMLCEGNIFLLDTLKKPKSDHSVSIARLAKRMETEWMIQSAAVAEICSAFWLAIGGEKEALTVLAEKAAAQSTKNTQSTSSGAPGKQPTNSGATGKQSANSGTPKTTAAPKTLSRTIPSYAVCQHSDYRIRRDVLEEYHGTSRCIVIPNGISTIGPRAFKNTIVEEVYIPEGVKVIDEEAFWNCTKLKVVSLPQSLTTIKTRAFNWCESLSHLTIPGSVTMVEHSAFGYCKGMKTLEIESGCKAIASFAFVSAESLEEVRIPGTISEVPIYAFSKCTRLRRVILEKGVTRISSKAFENCTALKQLDIPDSVTTIHSEAFVGCKGIQVNASAHWSLSKANLRKLIP